VRELGERREGDKRGEKGWRRKTVMMKGKTERRKDLTEGYIWNRKKEGRKGRPSLENNKRRHNLRTDWGKKHMQVKIKTKEIK
jgi:hypothetical protein